jgi:hypothetical protein
MVARSYTLRHGWFSISVLALNVWELQSSDAFRLFMKYEKMHFKRSQSVWEIVGVREEKNGMREWKLGQRRKVGRRYTEVKLVGKHISWKDREWDRLRNQEGGCGQGGKNSVYSLLKCLIRMFPPLASLSLKLQLRIVSRFEVGGGVLCACGPVHVGGLQIERSARMRKEWRTEIK